MELTGKPKLTIYVLNYGKQKKENMQSNSASTSVRVPRKQSDFEPLKGKSAGSTSLFACDHISSKSLVHVIL